MRNCIVYLAQNRPASATYGDDRAAKLERSLSLLHANYLNAYPVDVLIFHEGDFSEADQAHYRSRWPRVQFRKIEFALPRFLEGTHIPDPWPCPADRGPAEILFGIGYRHMINFYSCLIYPILERLGYDWYMRLDDDSFLLSPIRYDLFDSLQAGGFKYGYRVDTWDSVLCVRGFAQMVTAYLIAENIRPKFWQDNFGLDGVWNRHGYYNNFHMTEIAFWRRPEVREFLDFLDRVGGGYKYRWSDLPVQSTAVQIFMDKQQVYRFTDFDYEHITPSKLNPAEIGWGGRFLTQAPSHHCMYTKG